MTDLLQVMELLLCDSQGGGRLRQLFLEPNEVHVVPDGRPDDQTHHHLIPPLVLPVLHSIESRQAGLAFMRVKASSMCYLH
jgi:hypothetical protein